jgi:chromosome segregation ATPase
VTARARQKEAEDEVLRAKDVLCRSMPPDVFSGVENLIRVTAERNIDGVLGPIIELIDCDDRFLKAAEVRPL